MQFLKANTQVIVTVGPFVDVTDGFTPETGVDVSTSDEAELLKHGSTTVVDISGATWAAVTTADGYYSLTLTTSHTDTEGMLTIIVQDDSVCLPVRMQYMVLAEAAYDSMFTAKDTGFMDVNVKAVSEDTTAADNAEAFFDGTGYAGTNNVIPTVSTLTGHTAQTADHTANISAILTDTGTTLDGKIDTIDGIVDAILVDTGTTLDAALAVVDGNVDSILTDTGTTLPATLTTIEGKVDTVDTNVDAVLVDTGTTLPATLTTIEGKVDTVDSNVDAILVDTGTAGVAIADGSITAAKFGANAITATVIATDAIGSPELAASATAEIADQVWDESTAAHPAAGSFGAAVSDVLADTNELQSDDYPTSIAAVQTTADAIETDTQDIQSRLPAALVTGRMSSDAVAISGSTDAADKLEASAETIETGTAQTGTLSTTQMSTDLSEVTNDHYIGRIIVWTSGVLLRQATDITDYVGTNGVLTFTATTEAPSNGDTFIIV